MLIEKPTKYAGYKPTPHIRIQPMWTNPFHNLEQWWVPDGEPWDSDQGKWVLVQPQISQAMQDKLK